MAAPGKSELVSQVLEGFFVLANNGFQLDDLVVHLAEVFALLGNKLHQILLLGFAWAR